MRRRDSDISALRVTPSPMTWMSNINNIADAAPAVGDAWPVLIFVRRVRNAVVRIGLTLRYLASSVAAAVLTRMTKIATGHPSATAGAMSALLITLLVLAILNTKGEWVYDVTQAVTMGAFVGMSDANVLISSRVPLAGVIAVGYRLLTAPFCEGFAGIEAFCAFLAVATHRVCQPRQESLFERSGAGG